MDIDPETASETELRTALGDVVIDPEGLTRDDWLDLLMTHRLQPSFPDRPATRAVRLSGVAMRAGANPQDGQPPVAERFELYLGPLELANGYHELADAAEQGARFEHDLRRRGERGVRSRRATNTCWQRWAQACRRARAWPWASIG